MNTSENQWEKSTFVSATHVMHRPRTAPRRGKRLTGIIRSKQVKVKTEPVPIGPRQDGIQVSPIMRDGQIKALRVSCKCGCESTFDIQYGAGGTQHDAPNSGSNLPSGALEQRMPQQQDHAA